MNKNLSDKNLLEIINKALNKQGISARQASILATGTPELIRNMRRGRIPSVTSFRALCHVLNLEFYVGPIRHKKSTSARSTGGRPTLYSMFQEIISRLPPSEDTYIKMAEPAKPYKSSEDANVYYIPVFETNADASVPDNNKKEASYVAFQSNWFDKYNINPKHCVILEVRDGFMEPTIAKQSTVLVDRSRYRRCVGHIYAMYIGDKLIVGRLGKNKDQWQLIGDNPKSKTVPLPPSVKIIGEVKWAARNF